MYEVMRYNRPIEDINQAITPAAFTADLCNKWIEYLDVKPKTLETYTRSIKQFMLFLQDNDITAPQRSDIIAFRDRVNATHKPATVNLYLISVKQFFKWLEIEGIYPNIARQVKGCKLSDAHRKDHLTAGQAKSIISGIDQSTLTGKRDYAIFVLMLTTGLRDCEVMRADIEDLRTLGDNVVLYVHGKYRDGKDAYVKVTEPAEKAIRAYLAARGKAPETAALFASHSNRNEGGRMTTRSISRIIKNNLRAAGFDSNRITAHSLRHTAANLSLANGTDIRDLQQLLRHTNINTTMIYVRERSRADNPAEQRITDILFG